MLMQRINLRGALQLGSRIGTLCITGALSRTLWDTGWAVPASMVPGVILNFLYEGQHERSHGTVF